MISPYLIDTVTFDPPNFSALELKTSGPERLFMPLFLSQEKK